MKREILVGSACLALSACAQIDSVPLYSDGTEDQHQVHGIRYYMPAPYLLVAELPVSPQTPSSNSTGADTGMVQAGPGGGGGGGGGQQQKGQNQGSADDSSSGPQSSTPAAPATDTSFAASMVQYSIKLVYLPDMSKPMALQMQSGLLGTVSAAPSLTDGWMLTGMNGSSDAGVSDTITALAGLLGGGGSGSSTGGKAGGAAAMAASTGAAAAGATTQATVSPGDSDVQITRAGNDVGSGKALAPLPATINALSNAQKLVFIQGLLAGLATRPAPTVATTQTVQALPWGNNVLPAGLYRFVYADGGPNHTGGRLTGIEPVTYFCKTGMKTPPDKCIHDNGSLLPQ